MKPLRLMLALLVAINPVFAQQLTTLPEQSTPASEQSTPAVQNPGTTSEQATAAQQYEAGHYYEVEYRQLRRDTEMSFEYQLSQSPITRLCINLADQRDSNRQPVRLEFDPVPGLTFSTPMYPDPHRTKADLQPSVAGCTNYLTLKVKIYAAQTAPIGASHISGRIIWQTMGVNGSGAVQERAFDIPIEIVAKSEHVKRTDHFTRPSPAWWLFAPVAIGAALYCVVAEGVGAGCPWIQ